LIGGVVAKAVRLSDYNMTGREQTTAMAILPYGSGTQLTVNVIQSGGEVSVGKKQLTYASCGIGKYNSDPTNQGYFGCTACESGYTNSIDEAYACQLCPEGFYCSATDSTSCSTALVGSSSLPGSSSIANCSCPAAKIEYNQQCKDCAVGFSCGVPGLTVSTVPVLQGYWRTSSQSDDVRKCAIKELCTGGVGAGGDSICTLGQVCVYMYVLNVNNS
jgi:hypothetical protein